MTRPRHRPEMAPNFLHSFLASLWLALALIACTPASAQGQVLETTQPLPAWLAPLPVFSVLRMRTNLGNCSAVATSPHTALTAAHCLPPETWSVDLEGLDGKNYTLVSFMIPSKDLDLAVLTIKETFQTFAHVAQELPPTGDLVFVSGYGCFNSIDVRSATYLAIDHKQDIAMNGTVCLGDSGGPVFNAQGQVLGVIKSTPKERVPAAWATPVVGRTQTGIHP